MQGLTLTIGNRLLEIRKGAGMTQAAFAKRFEISSRAYASYELEERELPTSFVVKLSDELSINPNWLLSGQGARTFELKNEMIKAAYMAVRSFAMLKKLEIDSEREAELVVLLVKYFDQGGAQDTSFVQSMLENVT